MQVNPIRNSTMPAGAWRSWSMTLGNDRHFLHGKQKRAPTNFARGSITRHEEQLVLLRGSLLLIVSLSLSLSVRVIRRRFEIIFKSLSVHLRFFASKQKYVKEILFNYAKEILFFLER